MRLILVDPMYSVCESFKLRFEGLPDVEVVEGRFEDLPAFDCIVSPANSFGLMDGGVDAAITSYFGYQLMDRVQKRILEEYLGEQPVGTCMIVETTHPEHPYLAHSPTMRVPMPIAKTDNVYKAMWAMLLAVHQHNQRDDVKHIETIACPGLGTGYGRVPEYESARQMALAYKNYLHPAQQINWYYAGQRQEEIVFGGDFGFELPPNLKL